MTPMGSNRRAGIYCRMSKAKGEHKIEAQEAMCRTLAAQHDLEVVQVYVDDGISASTFKDRPGWAGLLADVEAGKLDVLMAQSEDRFTRQPMEKEALMLACTAAGTQWLTINEGATDPATADGAFFATMRAAVGRMENARKVERQKQASDARASQGLPQAGGIRPFGWAEDKVNLDPDESEHLRWAVDHILSGGSLRSIARRWNEEGVTTAVRGKAWRTSTVRQVLVRPRMAGLVKHRGEVLDDVRGVWEPLISAETYEELCQILAGGRGQTNWEARWLLSGLMTCSSCGNGMTSATGSGKRRIYRCRQGQDLVMSDGRRHMGIGMDLADEVVTEAVVSALTFASSWSLPDPDSEKLAALHASVRELSAAKGRLVDAVADGVLSGSDVAKKKSQLDADIAEAEESIARIASANAQAALIAEAREGLWAPGKVDVKDVAQAKVVLRERLDALDLEPKQALIRSLVDVTVEPGRGKGRVRVTHKGATTLNVGDEVGA